MLKLWTEEFLSAKTFQQTCMNLLVLSCECVGCHGVLKPPIRMCLNGHLLHVKCSRNTKCPACNRLCSQNLPGMLDQVLNIVSCLCVHTKHGCTEFVDNRNKEHHERFCQWRKVECLWCTWSGSLNKWFDHVNTGHGPEFLVSIAQGAKEIPLSTDVDKTHFFIDGVHFCLFAVRNRSEPLYLSFQCFPTTKEDLDTVLSIEIENDGLYLTQAIHPFSDSVKRKDVFKQLDNCVMVPKYLTQDNYSFSFKIVTALKVKNF